MSENRSTPPAIAVRGISKSFRIPINGSSSLKQKIINVFSHRKGYRDFTPLDNVSFEIQKGEFFGIVGRNGSGKSTLLKTIAGIYTPEKGHVKVNGLLVPFIELGVGFNPELTGRENVYLNGALLGFSRGEISAMYDEIVGFAELAEFMDERLKNYSSGMQVRLAFSIAIRAQGDILLLDEVLAVGDSAFQQKCFDYFEQIKREHRTIILVTHSMDAVKRFCSRALLLENGSIKMIGKPDEIADQYLVDNISSKPSNQHLGKPKSTVESLSARVEKKDFSRDDDLDIVYSYTLQDKTDVVLGLSIVKDGRSIAEMNSMNVVLEGTPGISHDVRFSAPLHVFNPGEYSLNISIFSRDNMEMLDYVLKVHDFVVKGADRSRGAAVFLDGEWKAQKDT